MRGIYINNVICYKNKPLQSFCVKSPLVFVFGFFSIKHIQYVISVLSVAIAIYKSFIQIDPPSADIVTVKQLVHGNIVDYREHFNVSQKHFLCFPSFNYRVNFLLSTFTCTNISMGGDHLVQ